MYFVSQQINNAGEDDDDGKGLWLSSHHRMHERIIKWDKFTLWRYVFSDADVLLDNTMTTMKYVY